MLAGFSEAMASLDEVMKDANIKLELPAVPKTAPPMAAEGHHIVGADNALDKLLSSLLSNTDRGSSLKPAPPVPKSAPPMAVEGHRVVGADNALDNLLSSLLSNTDGGSSLLKDTSNPTSKI